MLPTEKPINAPATIAAAKIPVPVAESQLSTKTAGSVLGGSSGFGAGTTGGTRSTTLCNPGTLNSGADIPLSLTFVHGSPHAKTNKLNSIHGAHARTISREPCVFFTEEVTRRSASDSSPSPRDAGVGRGKGRGVTHSNSLSFS